MDAFLELVGQTPRGAGIAVQVRAASDRSCMRLSCERALPEGAAVNLNYVDEGGASRVARGWIGAVSQPTPGKWSVVMVLERAA